MLPYLYRKSKVPTPSKFCVANLVNILEYLDTKIQSVPTLMIFKNGEVMHKQAGVHTKVQLMSILMSI